MTPLSKDPCQIYQYLLITRSLGTLPSDNQDYSVFPRREPNEPDNCITVYDQDPEKLGADMITGHVELQYGIQIRIRSKSSSFYKAREIVRSLEQVDKQQVTVDSASFEVNRCHLLSGPIPLGTSVAPNSGLYLFTINYASQIKELP